MELNVPSRTLFIADNLEVLRGINSESVDLIATDPPFNKGVKAFEGIVTAGVDQEGKKVRYKDVWTWGDVQSAWMDSIRQDHPNLYAVIRAANGAAGEDMGAFLCWLGVRVLEMHRTLKPTGSMYLHIDHTAHAYAKAMMDAIFGRVHFRSDIVWKRTVRGFKGSQHKPQTYNANTDHILFYAKTANALFDMVPVLEPYDTQYLAKAFRHKDDKGAYYLDVAYNRPSASPRPNLCYEYKEFYPPHPSGWKVGKPRMIELDNEGELVIEKDKLWRKVRPKQGRIRNNLWDDIAEAKGGERTGYPTQKPLALYERIIKASSNAGDVVMDPFAGCATTCVAAERLGRRWIGVDINREAKWVILQRLQRETQLPQGLESWNRDVGVKSKAPVRTDDGREAAPELVLVSPKPRSPRLSARELRGRLIIADGMKCQGCGWVPHHDEYLEVDHKVPKSREGRDDMRNRVLLCSPCNGAKGNKLTLAELRLRRIQEGRMADESWDMVWYERTGRFG